MCASRHPSTRRTLLFLLSIARILLPFFFFFNDTATTEIYTLSLHDALPICRGDNGGRPALRFGGDEPVRLARPRTRSEEHTSELQSRRDLVCRLLLEKKKKKKSGRISYIDDRWLLSAAIRFLALRLIGHRGW